MGSAVEVFGLGSGFLSSKGLLSERGLEWAVGGSGAGATEVIGGGSGICEAIILETRGSGRGGGVAMLWNGDPRSGMGGGLSRCSGTGLGFIFTCGYLAL